MDKYALLRKRVMASGEFRAEDVHIPPEATYQEIARVHDPNYINRFVNGKLTPQEIRRAGFPWSPALVARVKRSVGATIQACRFAMKDGIAVNLAGGTHHAFRDHGEGYCLLNDAAIAARAMQEEALCNRVVIVDCDVHQGNGTASIFAGVSTVFTFSIHGKNNFPFHKERSDLDIALKDGTGDTAYLQALEIGLLNTLEFPADLAIYLAGADPYKEDRMGRLSLSKKGLKERDRMVFRFCHGAGIPVAVTMAGGYSHSVSDTVDIHFGTIAAARQAKIELSGFGERTGP